MSLRKQTQGPGQEDTVSHKTSSGQGGTTPQTTGDPVVPVQGMQAVYHTSMTPHFVLDESGQQAQEEFP